MGSFMRLATRYRIPAALLAALWLITPVAISLHGLSERHVYCPEHGTLEEQPAESTLGPRRTAPDDEIDRRDPSAAHGEHAACSFAQVGAHAGVVAEAVSAVSSALDALLVPGLTRQAEHLGSIPVFRFAPKNSPPPLA
jgi:hypothetical protein